jgi:hypothetical protein
LPRGCARSCKLVDLSPPPPQRRAAAGRFSDIHPVAPVEPGFATALRHLPDARATAARSGGGAGFGQRAWPTRR